MKRKPYISLMGSLIYVATCTRPDVALSVCHLSRFMENPGSRHWKTVIRAFCYLKTTSDYGISYSESSGQLQVYSDVD